MDENRSIAHGAVVHDRQEVRGRSVHLHVYLWWLCGDGYPESTAAGNSPADDVARDSDGDFCRDRPYSGNCLALRPNCLGSNLWAVLRASGCWRITAHRQMGAHEVSRPI